MRSSVQADVVAPAPPRWGLTIQRDVSASVDAIGRIVGTVADINAIQTTIAGAVEEQTATTLDISRSLHVLTRRCVVAG